MDITDDVLAGRGKRFLNFIIDTLFYYVLSYGMGIGIGILYNLGIEGPLLWLMESSQLTQTLLGIVIVLLYYIIMESLTSKSIGKFITGTRVVTDEGTRPEAGIIALRTLCRCIPFEAFSFFNEQSRGWHDSLSDTYVVDEKKFKEAQQLKNSFDEIGKSEI